MALATLSVERAGSKKALNLKEARSNVELSAGIRRVHVVLTKRGFDGTMMWEVRLSRKADHLPFHFARMGN